MIPAWLAVSLGGAAGTLLRYGVNQAVLSVVGSKGFAIGTLIVNALGCLMMGYLFGFFEQRTGLDPLLKSTLTVGFLGGLTTFSSFSMDALRIAENHSPLWAGAYVLGSVVGGLLLAASGLALSRL